MVSQVQKGRNGVAQVLSLQKRGEGIKEGKSTGTPTKKKPPSWTKWTKISTMRNQTRRKRDFVSFSEGARTNVRNS